MISSHGELAARSLLKAIPDLQVIEEASNGLEAVEKAATLFPDVVLLDIGMPLLNGIEAARKIRQCCPESTIIFLTQQNDDDVRSIALATGADAYLVKSQTARDLRATIEKVLLNRLEPDAPNSRPLPARGPFPEDV